MIFNSLGDYAEILKLITSMVFLFQEIKHYKPVLSDRMDISLRAVICYLHLKGSLKLVHDNM